MTATFDAPTGAPDFAVRNGITINPPADFPYREAFMERFGHGTRPNYRLEAWEVLMWQALWLMPQDQLLATAQLTDGLPELLGDDYGLVVGAMDERVHYDEALYQQARKVSEKEQWSAFANFADLIARDFRPGDVTPAGTAVDSSDEVAA